MKYQALNDLIDPEVLPADAPRPEREDAPDAPNDAYVIGEHGNTVQAPGAERPVEEQTGPRAWVKPAAALLAALCLGLTLWNMARLLSGPPAPPKPTAFQVKQALYLGVMRVEAYRRVHGVTPDGLADAGLPNPPYAYRRVNPTQYTLTIDGSGSRLEYDSGIPMEKFFGTPQEMLTMGGSQ